MKHKIFFMIMAGLLMTTAWSCRQESDALMGYDQNEKLVFGDAETSFAAKFKVLWNGMNQYYAIWDYEAEYGLDWDAVYDEFLPQFEALDKRDSVPDDELRALMAKVFDPLHDGHLTFLMKNHTTGSSVPCQPGFDRVPSRDDYEASNLPVSLQYYANPANGQIETDADGNPIVMEYTTNAQDLLMQFSRTPGVGYLWIKDQVAELEALTSLTESQAFQLQQLKTLFEALTAAFSKPYSTWDPLVSQYNALQQQYSFLNVPGFDYIEPSFAGQNGISVKYALLKGNVAYFHLSKFYLTSFMDESETEFNMSNPATQHHVQQVKQVWQSWFDAVQQLHKSGTLGGVIIDVRSNGGGNMNDSKYVVGSLVPSGGIHFGYQRFKRGTARLDYSPLMPARVISMDAAHETITEPIVIMANCQSISMSETSVLCVKTLANGTFIGKRSFGAICALTGNDEHSFNYAGYIGIDGVTPVFGHVPTMASFTLAGQLIEAKGLTPDIEVDLDVNLFKATGQDTQLDRALQFIRTK
jgi:hypothetical protein